MEFILVLVMIILIMFGGSALITGLIIMFDKFLQGRKNANKIHKGRNGGNL